MADFDYVLTIKHLAVAFVPLMLGIILHEVAHGWMAAKRGDPTAAMLGRLTLNPLPHIDPAGLLFFVFSGLFGPFLFGWAKPVPINPRKFKNLVKDTMLVSFAGPAANFISAVAAAVLLRIFAELFPYQVWRHSVVWNFVFLFLYTGISINYTLAWFNLMPVPPLDGSKILWGLLPAEIGRRYMQLERYGMLIVLLLLLTGAFSYILLPLIQQSVDFTLMLVGMA